MKVGIIGSGGREHAICQILKKSAKIKERWKRTCNLSNFKKVNENKGNILFSWKCWDRKYFGKYKL